MGVWSDGGYIFSIGKLVSGLPIYFYNAIKFLKYPHLSSMRARRSRPRLRFSHEVSEIMAQEKQAALLSPSSFSPHIGSDEQLIARFIAVLIIGSIE